jgi:hypothetical protein
MSKILLKTDEEIVEDILDYHKYCTYFGNEEIENDSKLNYNYYNTLDFWADKFPKNYKDCVFIKPIIEKLLENHINSGNTPLKEILSKSEIKSESKSESE